MRLDKYLKVARVIKRRTVAKDISDSGRVYVNNKLAKSSTHLKVGDEIKLEFGNRVTIIKVTQLLDSTKKQDAEHMYELIKEETIQQLG